MDDIQALQQQLEEARDEAELNLLQLQLQQVQEEFEFYFLRCQDLDGQLTALQQQPSAELDAAAPADDRIQQLETALQERDRQLGELQRLRQEEQQLLSTAQTMLDGQARYLEDVSLREEKAAQALDRLRLLEAEVLYYISHSRPLPSLQPERIQRLKDLARALVEQKA